MLKHNLRTALFILLAAAGAGIYYYTKFPIVGQILFTLVTFASIFHTKNNASAIQLWWAVIMVSSFGGMVGDWWLSAVTVLAFFAINFRAFFLKTAIYSRLLWIELFIASTGLLAYFSINFFHHNSWQGWVFPAPFTALGIFIAGIGYVDRNRVLKQLEMGILEAGTIAPDFSLINFNGEKISLSDFKDKRDLLLIFVRGDWCPGCHIMLRLYERERKKFQDKKIMLIAIGPDPVGVNRAMVEKLGVEFAVLSDDTLEVSKKFCVRIQEDVPGMKFDPGIPLPASFLVDKKGIIRYTSRADRAGEFLRPDIIFDVLAKI
jgi:peroxiredoxin